MAELSKEMKIVLLANAIVAFIFAVLLLIITDVYAEMTEADPYCPISFRQVGATILILGICSMLAIKRNDWDKMKLYFELAIMWIAAMLIIGFLEIGTAKTDVAVANAWFNNVILIVLLVVDIYFYLQEEK